MMPNDLNPEKPTVRPATAGEALAGIYNHYVAETIVTFEEEPVSPSEMARRIAWAADSPGPEILVHRSPSETERWLAGLEPK